MPQTSHENDCHPQLCSRHRRLLCLFDLDDGRSESHQKQATSLLSGTFLGLITIKNCFFSKIAFACRLLDLLHIAYKPYPEFQIAEMQRIVGNRLLVNSS